MKLAWLLSVIVLFAVGPAVSAPVDRIWDVRPDALIDMFPTFLMPGEYLFQECKQEEANFFACSLIVSKEVSFSVASASKTSSTDTVALNCFCEFPAYSNYAFKLMRAATSVDEAQLETVWRQLGEKGVVVIDNIVLLAYRDNGASVLMIALNK